MEDAQCLSRITARARHHQEGVGRQMGEGTGTRGRQQQGVRDRSYLRQHRLCQQVGVRSATRPVLSGSMERLP